MKSITGNFLIALTCLLPTGGPARPAGPAVLLERRLDQGRKAYLKRYYGKDVDDPLLYHLTLNTDLDNADFNFTGSTPEASITAPA